MPAAYYELSVEQGSDFVSAFRILGPAGNLFKFIPSGTTQRVWTNNTLNIDVPEEIKLAYSDNDASFGWLKTAAAEAEYLQIRSTIKSSSSTTALLSGTARYKNNGGKTQTGNLIFDFVTNNTNYNLLLKITNASTSASSLTGKYLYDIELEYKLGSGGSTSFVIRLLQGKVTFNPNITT
jgi:hypothetical protein